MWISCNKWINVWFSIAWISSMQWKHGIRKVIVSTLFQSWPHNLNWPPKSILASLQRSREFVIMFSRRWLFFDSFQKGNSFLDEAQIPTAIGNVAAVQHIGFYSVIPKIELFVIAKYFKLQCINMWHLSCAHYIRAGNAFNRGMSWFLSLCLCVLVSGRCVYTAVQCVHIEWR